MYVQVIERFSVECRKVIVFILLRYRMAFFASASCICFEFCFRFYVTRESLGEFEKAVETQHFLFSQTCTRVSNKQLDYELEIFIVR